MSRMSRRKAARSRGNWDVSGCASHTYAAPHLILPLSSPPPTHLVLCRGTGANHQPELRAQTHGRRSVDFADTRRPELPHKPQVRVCGGTMRRGRVRPDSGARAHARHHTVAGHSDEIAQCPHPELVHVIGMCDEVHDLPLLIPHVDDGDPAGAVILVCWGLAESKLADGLDVDCGGVSKWEQSCGNGSPQLEVHDDSWHPNNTPDLRGRLGGQDSPFPPLSDGHVMVLALRVTITFLIFLLDTLRMGTPEANNAGIATSAAGVRAGAAFVVAVIVAFGGVVPVVLFAFALALALVAFPFPLPLTLPMPVATLATKLAMAPRLEPARPGSTGMVGRVRRVRWRGSHTAVGPLLYVCVVVCCVVLRCRRHVHLMGLVAAAGGSGKGTVEVEVVGNWFPTHKGRMPRPQLWMTSHYASSTVHAVQKTMCMLSGTTMGTLSQTLKPQITTKHRHYTNHASLRVG